MKFLTSCTIWIAATSGLSSMVTAKTQNDARGLRKLGKAPTVTGFDLYDATTDTKIQSLSNGDVVVLCDQQVTIEAISPGSYFVKMLLKDANGQILLRNLDLIEPFTLGMNDGSDYSPVPQLSAPGEYTVKAKAKSATSAFGNTLSVQFTLLECPKFSAFKLFDAAEDVLIKAPIVEGDQIATCADQLTIEADVSGAYSVRMKLKDASGAVIVSNLEIVEPWTLGGNAAYDYFPVPQLTVGEYTICAIPRLWYTGYVGTEVCVSFEILPCAP